MEHKEKLHNVQPKNHHSMLLLRRGKYNQVFTKLCTKILSVSGNAAFSLIKLEFLDDFGIFLLLKIERKQAWILSGVWDKTVLPNWPHHCWYLYKINMHAVVIRGRWWFIIYLSSSSDSIAVPLFMNRISISISIRRQDPKDYFDAQTWGLV